MRLVFHFVMMTSFIFQSCFENIYKELWIWVFFFCSFFGRVGCGTIYCWTSFQAYCLILISAYGSPTIQPQKNYKGRFGFCQSYMLLSYYMHFKHWTGYMRKLNCEPALLMNKIHRLGLNLILLFNYRCLKSRNILRDRYGSSFKSYISNVLKLFLVLSLLLSSWIKCQGKHLDD